MLVISVIIVLTSITCLYSVHWAYKCTWCGLFQKRVVHTKFDIYVFITINNVSKVFMIEQDHMVILLLVVW